MKRKFDLSLLINRTGRLPISELKRLVSETKVSAFENEFPHPSFVGTSLKAGEFAQDYMVNQSTMKFIDDADKVGSSLESAVFPIFRMPESTSPIGEFSIGRTDENDIVMNDYSISKRHAKIFTSKEGYKIIDLGSRNGITINEDFIEPNKEYDLIPGLEIGIGRYQFNLVHARELYAKISP